MGTDGGGKNYILTELTEKMVNGLETVETYAKNYKKDTTLDASLDSIIAKKKANIERLRKMRQEFNQML